MSKSLLVLWASATWLMMSSASQAPGPDQAAPAAATGVPEAPKNSIAPPGNVLQLRAGVSAPSLGARRLSHTATVVSTGSSDAPHCSWWSTCDNTTLPACATALCQSAGYAQGELASTSNNPCSAQFEANESHFYFADVDEIISKVDSANSQITALCSELAPTPPSTSTSATAPSTASTTSTSASTSTTALGFLAPTSTPVPAPTDQEASDSSSDQSGEYAVVSIPMAWLGDFWDWRSQQSLMSEKVSHSVTQTETEDWEHSLFYKWLSSLLLVRLYSVSSLITGALNLFIALVERYKTQHLPQKEEKETGLKSKLLQQAQQRGFGVACSLVSFVVANQASGAVDFWSDVRTENTLMRLTLRAFIFLASIGYIILSLVEMATPPPDRQSKSATTSAGAPAKQEATPKCAGELLQGFPWSPEKVMIPNTELHITKPTWSWTRWTKTKKSGFFGYPDPAGILQLKNEVEEQIVEPIQKEIEAKKIALKEAKDPAEQERLEQEIKDKEELIRTRVKEATNHVDKYIEKQVHDIVDPALRIAKNCLRLFQLALVLAACAFGYFTLDLKDETPLDLVIRSDLAPAFMPDVKGARMLGLLPWQYTAAHFFVALVFMALHAYFSDAQTIEYSKRFCTPFFSCFIKGRSGGSEPTQPRASSTCASCFDPEKQRTHCLWIPIAIWDEFMKMTLVLGSVFCIIQSGKFRGTITTEASVEAASLWAMLTVFIFFFLVLMAIKFLWLGVQKLWEEE